MLNQTSLSEKFVLAKRDESCWREGAKIYEGRADGPYALTEQEGVWVVWSGAGEAAHCETEQEGLVKMAELAEQWRQSCVRWVYFIGAECRLGEPVKIGIAYNPKARLSGIQSSWPFDLRLLAMHPGGREEEKRYHAKFRHCRLRGEWFKITPALKRLIEQHAA